jgi:hypothetical protein
VTSPDNDQILLVLAPNTPDGAHSPESVTIEADCGHTSWISPAGMAALLAQRARTTCLPCAEQRNFSEASSIETVPGAREELASLLGQKKADLLIDSVLQKSRRRQRRS